MLLLVEYVRLSTRKTWHEGWLSSKPTVGILLLMTYVVYQGRHCSRERMSLAPVLQVGRNWFLTNSGKYVVSRVPPPSTQIFPTGFRFSPPGLYVRMIGSKTLVEGYLQAAPKVAEPIRLKVTVVDGVVVAKPYLLETPIVVAMQGIWIATQGCGIFGLVAVPPFVDLYTNSRSRL